MPISKGLLGEFQYEMNTLRTLLQRVPVEKFSYKPHEKSMSLEQLSVHLAQIPGWIKETLLQDELDFGAGGFTPPVVTSSAELLDLFEKSVVTGAAAIESTADEEYSKMWTMRAGEKIFFSQPKMQVYRAFVMGHMIHHRGQLSVYLRMLDVPLPQIYGPSADDPGQW